VVAPRTWSRRPRRRSRTRGRLVRHPLWMGVKGERRPSKAESMAEWTVRASASASWPTSRYIRTRAVEERRTERHRGPRGSPLQWPRRSGRRSGGARRTRPPPCEAGASPPSHRGSSLPSASGRQRFLDGCVRCRLQACLSVCSSAPDAPAQTRGSEGVSSLRRSGALQPRSGKARGSRPPARPPRTRPRAWQARPRRRLARPRRRPSSPSCPLPPCSERAPPLHHAKSGAAGCASVVLTTALAPSRAPPVASASIAVALHALAPSWAPGAPGSRAPSWARDAARLAKPRLLWRLGAVLGASPAELHPGDESAVLGGESAVLGGESAAWRADPTGELGCGRSSAVVGVLVSAVVSACSLSRRTAESRAALRAARRLGSAVVGASCLGVRAVVSAPSPSPRSEVAEPYAGAVLGDPIGPISCSRLGAVLGERISCSRLGRSSSTAVTTPASSSRIACASELAPRCSSSCVYAASSSVCSRRLSTSRCSSRLAAAAYCSR